MGGEYTVEVYKCPECARRFAEGFVRGRESVYRKNDSGCVCVFDDNDSVIKVCGAHQEMIEEALKGIKHGKGGK